MQKLKEKAEIIRREERRTADKIAQEVLDKPNLSVWMILIPIVFLYYIYAFNRFSSGKKEFVEGFVKTRKLILEKALNFVENKEKTDFRKLAKEERVPDKAVDAYVSWSKVLFDHYTTLLSAEGASYSEMNRSGYTSKEQYESVLEKIIDKEVLFFKALRKEVKASGDAVGEVIKKMETAVANIRRSQVRLVFG